MNRDPRVDPKPGYVVIYGPLPDPPKEPKA
jgi:hypothetical protein